MHQQGAWSDSELITEFKKNFAEYYVTSAILYREVPHKLHAKYKKKKLAQWFWSRSRFNVFLPYLGMAAILNFISWPF